MGLLDGFIQKQDEVTAEGGLKYTMMVLMACSKQVMLTMVTTSLLR